MTEQEALKWAEMQLKEAGIYEYRSDAWILFSCIFQMSRVDFMMSCVNSEENLEEQSKEKWEEFKAAVSRRKKNIPVQYITKEQNFYGYDFYVDERVLIPRQDTEVLIECVQQEMQKYMLEHTCTSAGRLLDLCTGSGCIAITLANVLKWDDVVATDISEDALSVAAKNNQTLGNLVRLVHSDLFTQVSGMFDVIVSNPPYIEADVIPTLAPEVREHEPYMALDGGKDGLHFYRQIIAQAPAYLRKNGYLFLEIGADQAQAVRQLCEEQKNWQQVQVVKDLAGLDRVLWAKRI